MKRNLKIFSIGYVAFLVLSVISCVPNCGGAIEGRYSVFSFNWTIKNIVEDDNGHFILGDVINNTISYDEFGIILNTDTYLIALKTENVNLLQSAYACEPAVHALIEDKLENITIRCTNDFNSDFIAGTDLKSLFDVIISGQRNQYTQQKSDLVEYIDSNPFISEQMTLVLKSPPTVSGNYQFEVKISVEGDDLENFEFITDETTIGL